MKNRKVVITGGAGFIGSNLARQLVQENTVVIIDDCSTGRLENIADLANKSNVTFIQDSILNLPLLIEVTRGADFVFHLAAVVSVPQSIRNPKQATEVNVNGTLNVLLAGRDNSVKKVIYSSSCAVYGDTRAMPLTEETPLNPLSPYALTKLVAEYYCRIFQKVYYLPSICLRYFNVYGPGQDPKSEYAAVIPKFLSLIPQNKPLTIFGDGNQTRDFVYIRDVVQANIHAAETEATGVFNVGTGRSVSVNELAKTIMRITGSKVPLVYKEAREGEIRYSLASIEKAKTLGYIPRFDLEEGLRETLRSLNISDISDKH